MFDPYHRWLQIPKDQRPPNYFQLLGLVFGESDKDVIHEAYLKQTQYVRGFQSGPHGEDAIKILRELAQAANILGDESRRNTYLAQLADQAKPKPETPSPAPTKSTPAVAAPPAPAPVPAPSPAPTNAAAPPSAPKKQPAEGTAEVRKTPTPTAPKPSTGSTDPEMIKVKPLEPTVGTTPVLPDFAANELSGGRPNSGGSAFGWPALALFGGLILVSGVVAGLWYVNNTHQTKALNPIASPIASNNNEPTKSGEHESASNDTSKSPVSVLDKVNYPAGKYYWLNRGEYVSIYPDGAVVSDRGERAQCSMQFDKYVIAWKDAQEVHTFSYIRTSRHLIGVGLNQTTNVAFPIRGIPAEASPNNLAESFNFEGTWREFSRGAWLQYEVSAYDVSCSDGRKGKWYAKHNYLVVNWNNSKGWHELECSPGNPMLAGRSDLGGTHWAPANLVPLASTPVPGPFSPPSNSPIRNTKLTRPNPRILSFLFADRWERALPNGQTTEITVQNSTLSNGSDLSGNWRRVGDRIEITWSNGKTENMTIGNNANMLVATSQNQQVIWRRVVGARKTAVVKQTPTAKPATETKSAPPPTVQIDPDTMKEANRQPTIAKAAEPAKALGTGALLSELRIALFRDTKNVFGTRIFKESTSKNANGVLTVMWELSPNDEDPKINMRAIVRTDTNPRKQQEISQLKIQYLTTQPSAKASALQFIEQVTALSYNKNQQPRSVSLDL